MKNKKYVFTAVLFFTALVCFGSDTPPPPPPPPNSLPIDGGLIFLLLTAVLFGIKKLKN